MNAHYLIHRQLYSIVLKIVLKKLTFSHNCKTDFLPDDYFSHKTFQTLLMKRLFKLQVNFSELKINQKNMSGPKKLPGDSRPYLPRSFPWSPWCRSCTRAPPRSPPSSCCATKWRERFSARRSRRCSPLGPSAAERRGVWRRGSPSGPSPAKLGPRSRSPRPPEGFRWQIWLDHWFWKAKKNLSKQLLVIVDNFKIKQSVKWV